MILAGSHAGTEGTCVGKADGGKWAVSPDDTDEILQLAFEKEFGSLVDLSGSPEKN